MSLSPIGSKGGPVQSDDLILISVDDHINEPATMFDAHVPERYREQAPRIVDLDDGGLQWFYGDVRGRSMGLQAVAGKPREFYNVDATRFEEMRPGCYDVHERVRDMNAGGQLAGLNFPNWPGFAGQVLSQGADPGVNDIMIKAYNDWHVDEWCGAYPERFIPCGIIPQFDPELAVEEVRRLADKGCHAISFTETAPGKGLHDDYWDPVFAVCQELSTVVCAHLGSAGRQVPLSPGAPPSIPMALSPVMAIATFADFLWSQTFQKFPRLRVSLTEGDIGWMPYFVQKAEGTWDRHQGWTKHDFGRYSGPEEIFRTNLLVCFIDDRVGVENLHRFNLDNVFWESDFPHSEGPWPYAPERVSACLAGVPDDVVNKITHENAIRHYQLDPFGHRPRERCTAGALRAESPDVDVVTHVGRPADRRDLEWFGHGGTKGRPVPAGTS
jgi:predicted TIM-barrel fold metal-dependent hydrolase